METPLVSEASGLVNPDVSELVLDAERLFFAAGFGRTGKKTIRRHFPGKRGALSTVPGRQSGRMEQALTEAAEASAGTEPLRIRAPQLLPGRGGPMLRSYVEHRAGAVPRGALVRDSGTLGPGDLSSAPGSSKTPRRKAWRMFSRAEG